MKNSCIILLAVYAFALITMCIVMGWDNYSLWWKNHQFLRFICEIVGVLLIIPLFSNKKKEEE